MLLSSNKSEEGKRCFNDGVIQDVVVVVVVYLFVETDNNKQLNKTQIIENINEHKSGQQDILRSHGLWMRIPR